MDDFKANIVLEVMRRHGLVSFADKEGERGRYVTEEQAKRQKDNPELWEAVKEEIAGIWEASDKAQGEH
jgi:hypothetical protein